MKRVFWTASFLLVAVAHAQTTVPPENDPHADPPPARPPVGETEARARELHARVEQVLREGSAELDVRHSGIAVRAAELDRREAAILGLLVFSHWVLDALSHRPDLPLWPGSATMIGLGLWNSVPWTLVVEGALFAAGVWIYVRAAPARDRIGAWAFRGLIAFLVLAYLGNVFGPPPPSVTAIAVAGLAGGVLFTAWAWWADRHRGAR